jgi:hypothetical protein
LAGDAEAREEEYMVSGPYTGPLTVVRVHEYKTAWRKFRARLTEGDARVLFHREASNRLGEA